MPLYHYCVVRDDIPVGNIAAQLTHAAGESASLLEYPLPKGTHAVVLSVSSEAALLELEERLLAFKHTFCAIREPDPPFDNQLMAIGLLPSPRKTYKKVLANLPLFGKERNDSKTT